MNLRSDPVKGEFNIISYAASVFIHALIFIVSGILLHLSFNNSPAGGSGYMEVTTGLSQSPAEVKELPVQQPNIQEAPVPEDDEVVSKEQKPIIKEEKSAPAPEALQNAAASPGIKNITFNGANTDTSSLNNVYSEKTLNVSIKYPAGWAYIDQNRKNKLDGVTFMATAGSIKPPPYVHLAVQTKDMFIESRYKYSIKTWNYTAYYNDPEEMAGQVSQVFYIRTETDEDYSIKFIMQGMDNFKAFQPVFFGMVKTFKFGDGWF
jgi:hypothetical protein